MIVQIRACVINNFRTNLRLCLLSDDIRVYIVHLAYLFHDCGSPHYVTRNVIGWPGGISWLDALNSISSITRIHCIPGTFLVWSLTLLFLPMCFIYLYFTSALCFTSGVYSMSGKTLQLTWIFCIPIFHWLDPYLFWFNTVRKFMQVWEGIDGPI